MSDENTIDMQDAYQLAADRALMGLTTVTVQLRPAQLARIIHAVNFMADCIELGDPRARDLQRDLLYLKAVQELNGL